METVRTSSEGRIRLRGQTGQTEAAEQKAVRLEVLEPSSEETIFNMLIAEKKSDRQNRK